MNTFGNLSNSLTSFSIFDFVIKEPVGLFGLLIIIKLVLFVINFSKSSISISKLFFSFNIIGIAFAPLKLIVDLYIGKPGSGYIISFSLPPKINEAKK